MNARRPRLCTQNRDVDPHGEVEIRIPSQPQDGKVIDVGGDKMSDDGTRIPLDVKAGDRTCSASTPGSDVKVEDEEYLILRVEDVLAILE